LCAVQPLKKCFIGTTRSTVTRKARKIEDSILHVTNIPELRRFSMTNKKQVSSCGPTWSKNRAIYQPWMLMSWCRLRTINA
jgi:hypothetical protein